MNKTGKTNGFLLTSTFILTLVALVGIGTLGYVFFAGSSGGPEKDVVIWRGTSVAGVSRILGEENIISRPRLFNILLRVTNGEQRLHAGEYRFKEGMSLLDALFVLYHDDPITHTVTIPEGWRILQIAEILERAGLVKKEKFTEYTLSPGTPQKFGLKSPSMEGFLFPDTYHFSKVDGVEKITEVMARGFLTRWKPEHTAKAKTFGFTREELVTLASIIEKETGTSKERELISSVFHNRLRKRMRLQSDPTTIYGIVDFDGNLKKKHLLERTDYNTYKIRGLTPGPIANPGWAAIQAALEPADTDYLYFVANNQGGHVFSKTYAQHNKYVDQYQRSGRRRRSASNGK